MGAADSEEGEPEEADADGGEADDGGEEEEEGEKEEDDVVYWEDFRGLEEESVDRLEDLGVGEDVAAGAAAGRILDLVDGGNEHRGPDDEDDANEEDTADQFDGAEYGTGLMPDYNGPVLTFASSFCGKTLASDESALVSNERL